MTGRGISPNTFVAVQPLKSGPKGCGYGPPADIAPRSSDVRSSPQHRTLLRPLAIFEKCQKRKSPSHSITARHTGSHGKPRNRVATWSYRSTDLPVGLSDDFPVQPSLQKYFA